MQVFQLHSSVVKFQIKVHVSRSETLCFFLPFFQPIILSIKAYKLIHLSLVGLAYQLFTQHVRGLCSRNKPSLYIFITNGNTLLRKRSLVTKTRNDMLVIAEWNNSTVSVRIANIIIPLRNARDKCYNRLYNFPTCNTFLSMMLIHARCKT